MRIIVVSLTVHLALIFGFYAAGVWHLDRLEVGRLSAAIDTLLPPSPAPAGGASPSKALVSIPKHTVHAVVQPAPPMLETKPSTSPGTGTGSGEGSGDGSGDAQSTGECHDDCGEGSGSAVAPAIVQGPVNVMVPTTVLRGLRRSGETQIHPSDATKAAMLHAGHARVTAVFKLCVAKNGTVASVTQIKSSGYAEYDQQLVGAMRSWIYNPYEIDGQAVPACAAVTFLYEIE
jgi:TonB family protein